MIEPTEDLTGSTHQIQGATVQVARHALPGDVDDCEELELMLESGHWPSGAQLLEHFGKGRRGSVQTMRRVGVVRLEDGLIDSLWEDEDQ